jgi:hypothetical protein
MGGKSLYLWNTRYYGVPETIEQVHETFNHLSEGVEDDRNEGFKLFASILKASLEINSTKVDPEIIRAFEGLERRAAAHKEALFQVDLPPYAWLEAMRMIVDIASGFHLLVYEDQVTGMAFIPLKGKVLPPSEQDVWTDLLYDLDHPTFPQTTAQFKKYLKPKLDQFMLSHGFSPGKIPFLIETITYVRNCPIGQQYIGLDEDSLRGGGTFNLELYAYVVNDAVLEIYRRVDFSDSNSIFSTSISRLTRGTSTIVSNPQELKSLFQRVEDAFFASLLDPAQDLQGLDQLLNGPVATRLSERGYNSSFYAPQRLILARLAGNPHFEELVTEFEGYVDFARNEKNRVSEWPKLVKYLREEVKPITPNSDNIA